MPGDAMSVATFPAKPPKYWVEAKQAIGISAQGAGRIWYHTYDMTRRLIAWMAADNEEWAAYGMRKPQ
jgi:hypothetical protein